MKNLLLKIITFIFVFIDGFGQNNSIILNSQQSSEWKIISEIHSSTDLNKIYFIDSTNGWVIGNSGKISFSNDGGLSWISQNSGTMSDLLSIIFLDSTRGFISGSDCTLLYTNNKGNTWHSTNVENDSSWRYHSLCTSADTNLYFISNNGKIFKSDDFGKKWSVIYKFQGMGYVYLDYTKSPTCFAMPLWFDKFYKSTDGGNSWNIFSLPFVYSGNIYFIDNKKGWVTENLLPSSSDQDSVSIYTTEDGGASWNKQETFLGIMLHDIIFLNNNEGWVCGIAPGKIYYSLDGGNSWTIQFELDEYEYVQDIFFLNRKKGWVLTTENKVLLYSMPSSHIVGENDYISEHEYILYKNYPNPFNAKTRISFFLPRNDCVTLDVVNMLGQTITTLVSGYLAEGNYSYIWDANDRPSSIYFYRLRGTNFSQTLKMLLVR